MQFHTDLMCCSE